MYFFFFFVNLGAVLHLQAMDVVLDMKYTWHVYTGPNLTSLSVQYVGSGFLFSHPA